METKDYLAYVAREIHTTIVATVDDEGLPFTAAIDIMDHDENSLFAGYMARYRLQSENVEICYPDEVVWNTADTIYYWLSEMQPKPVAGVEIVQPDMRGAQ